MARALATNGAVISIERDERHAAFAERYIERAGLATTVRVRRGRALDVLPSLDGEQFDLAFLDADRAPLVTYFEWALRLVRPGGIIVAHNVLLAGRVANQESPDDDDELRAVRAFNARVSAERRVSSILMPAYDGLLVAAVDTR
jgi:caffeoyl-CoA O-methyltransferase